MIKRTVAMNVNEIKSEGMQVHILLLQFTISHLDDEQIAQVVYNAIMKNLHTKILFFMSFHFLPHCSAQNKNLKKKRRHDNNKRNNCRGDDRHWSRSKERYRKIAYNDIPCIFLIFKYLRFFTYLML